MADITKARVPVEIAQAEAAAKIAKSQAPVQIAEAEAAAEIVKTIAKAETEAQLIDAAMTVTAIGILAENN